MNRLKSSIALGTAYSVLALGAGCSADEKLPAETYPHYTQSTNKYVYGYFVDATADKPSGTQFVCFTGESENSLAYCAHRDSSLYEMYVGKTAAQQAVGSVVMSICHREGADVARNIEVASWGSNSEKYNKSLNEFIYNRLNEEELADNPGCLVKIDATRDFMKANHTGRSIYPVQQLPRS